MAKSGVQPAMKGQNRLAGTRPSSPTRNFLIYGIGLLLIAATIVVYWEVRNHEFISFDDNEYVTQNPRVKSGLSLSGAVWAFTAVYSNNWHPLTWLSHMLDCELYGLNPAGHHVTNLFFHIVNTLLLFLVLVRMTGEPWKSGFVAALFALHPLHVESVAWVSERKDVLSAFFWLLTVWAYIRYSRRPRIDRYLVMLLFFVLGLLSKPMLVTLPFVLLMLDYWPIGRLQLKKSAGSQPPSMNSRDSKSSVFTLIAEKLPLFALTVLAAIMTVHAQEAGGTLKTLDLFPLESRIANALISYVSYIGKMIWPPPMAILYPYPDHFSVWRIVGAVLFLIGISVWAFRTRRSRPYWAVGWFWYVGTLVPVIGLVQVGMQAMADRYTYIPLIGLFMMVAWGVPDILKGWRYRKVVIAVGSILSLVTFAVLTWSQVQWWKSSITLFEHTVHATSRNFLIHNKLGNALFQRGEIEQAVTHYQEALRINPDFVEAYNNIGNAFFLRGDVPQAIDCYQKALSHAPDYADAHNNLGFALTRQGKIAEALTHYREALRIRPDFEQAQSNLRAALGKQGKDEGASTLTAQGAGRKFDDPDGHNNAGVALARQGKRKEALVEFAKALEIDPNSAEAHCNMGNCLIELGRAEEAMVHYRKALQIKPDYPMARYNLGNALLRQGKADEAIIHYTEAIRKKPEFAEAHYSRGVAYLLIGNRSAAMEEREVLRKIRPDLANSLAQRMSK